MGSFSESQTWDVVDICIWNAKRDKNKKERKSEQNIRQECVHSEFFN